jgi:hypothetical protein
MTWSSGSSSEPARKAVVALLLVLWAGLAAAGQKTEPPPPLPVEHTHPSGAFVFRTPEGWTLTRPPDRPETLEVWSGDLGLRFVFREGEAGYDSLHATCMLERLAAPMETEPRTRYEYDFVGGAFGSRRALDSAFVVRYDRDVRGHRAWRQRTLTVVGGGQSLCAITYAPEDVWRKSARARATLEGVLASVVFRR